MGEQLGRQDRLFYEFCLAEVMPSDHLLRRIDAVLDLSWVRRELAPFYSHTGCPSVDSDAFDRLLRAFTRSLRVTSIRFTSIILPAS